MFTFQNYFQEGDDIEYHNGVYLDGCKIVQGNRTVCPPVKPRSDSSDRYGNGFRSFSCRCKQKPIICQPTDDWVVIVPYDNSESTSKGQCKYTKVENIK